MPQSVSAKAHGPRRLYFRPSGGGLSRLSITVARNLRKLRKERGYSQEELAEAIGVVVAALDVIETGRGEPTLEFAWRIAAELDVPFAALVAGEAPRGAVVLRKDAASVFVSEDLGLTSRPLFPFDEEHQVEFYELRLAPNHRETSRAHRPGTVEMLFVAKGSLEVTVGNEPAKLVNKGDSIVIPADLSHSYRNATAEPAILYLVMHYRDPQSSGLENNFVRRYS